MTAIPATTLAARRRAKARERDIRHCACGDHSFIPLGGGQIAMVSPGDAHLLTGAWHLLKSTSGRIYARCGVHDAVAYARGERRARTIYLHQLVIEVAPGKIVDHENRNGLDCRRSNVRKCDRDLNSRNTTRWRIKIFSAYKGVSFKTGQWTARICVNHKSIWLGGFALELDAALAYDKAALKYFGRFAALNFEHIAAVWRRAA